MLSRLPILWLAGALVVTAAACPVAVPGTGGVVYRCTIDTDCLADHRCGDDGTCVKREGTPLADGGRSDSGAPDAGTPDGGTPDGGLADGGLADGGPLGPEDGGADAGQADAGAPDAGTGDAGALDAGSDGGAPDAGPGRCGNGAMDPGEACDDGNADNRDGCTTACRLAGCGDGYVQSGLGEQCDDGNAVDDGNGCLASCQREDGFTCVGQPSVCTDQEIVLLAAGDSLVDAIANASDDDIIYLEAGTYDGRFDINGPVLSIVGEPGARIHGTSNGSNIKVKGGAVVRIQGVQLSHEGDDDDYPIKLEGGSTLHLVDCAIGPSNAVGVHVDNNNSNYLTMSRNVVSHNALGGVRSGNAYRITSNVVVQNGGPMSDIGGVHLANENGTFSFNTVADNQSADTVAGGVICSASGTAVSASILWNDTGLGEVDDNCVLSDTPLGTDPLFSPGSYRLSATSPLIDAVPAAALVDVAVDVDGDPRPLGAGYDVGADEVP